MKGKSARGGGTYLWTITAPPMQRNNSMRMDISDGGRDVGWWELGGAIDVIDG